MYWKTQWTPAQACRCGIQPFIRLHVVQTGSSMLSITADNTSSGSPNWSGDKLLSTKHSGYGIGTESIRMIAERYSGDARFRWKDGIFYASVMLIRGLTAETGFSTSVIS
ncbi:MAG: GHKL domain-containing protein [Pilosibacter sp.]